MVFEKVKYKEEFEKLLTDRGKKKFFIKPSNASFKVKKFVKKGRDSLALANYIKNSDENAKDY